MKSLQQLLNFTSRASWYFITDNMKSSPRYIYTDKQNDEPGQGHGEYNQKRKLLAQFGLDGPCNWAGLVILILCWYFVHRYACYSQC